MIDTHSPVQPRPFMGHYIPWRRARLLAIVERYGRDWFPGKSLLDLGCAHGHLGINLATLGAEVTFCDARKSNLDELAQLWPMVPDNRIICADLEKDWPFEKRFDMILHQGLLYHMENWEFSIRNSAASANHIILETEVCDGEGDDVLIRAEIDNKVDTAMNGISTHASADAIEKVLQESGLQFERLDDNRCNSGPHVYDWEVKGTKARLPCHRRWWWCWT